MKRILVAAALTVGGCGGGDNIDRARAEVWLQGSNAAAYDSVLLSVRGLAASADGKALRTSLRPSALKMELSLADHPYLVGYVETAGAGAVAVALTFDDFGGYQRGDEAGAIDARTAPVRFTAAASELGLHNHAVVRLDVERSLAPSPTDDSRLLLANTVVGY